MPDVTTEVKFTIRGSCNDARLDYIKQVIRQITESSEPEFTTIVPPDYGTAVRGYKGPTKNWSALTNAERKGE